MHQLPFPFLDKLQLNPIVSIEFPTEKLRSRKVVHRGAARGTGKYPSWKAGRMLQFESINELNAFRLLDADPNVVAFNEQPCVITYLVDGKEHSHFPDLFVRTATEKQLWEVKPSVQACDPEVLTRTSLLTGALRDHGYEYRLVIAEHLTRQPRLETVITLLRFGRGDIPLADREHMRNVLASGEPVTWGGVLTGALGPKGRDFVCRLALEGKIEWDPDAKLSQTTVLRLKATQEPASKED